MREEGGIVYRSGRGKDSRCMERGGRERERQGSGRDGRE